MVKIRRSTTQFNIWTRLFNCICSVRFASGVICTLLLLAILEEEEVITVIEPSTLPNGHLRSGTTSSETSRSNSVVKHGFISCDEIYEAQRHSNKKPEKDSSNSRSGGGGRSTIDWLSVDPNKGKLYARTTITEPQFTISLHSEEYDNVRWKTIMETGKYYEDHVHNYFVEVLSSIPPTTTNSYVIDVGANIGYYTLLSAAILKQRNIISFEPNPANIIRICESLRLNNWETATTTNNNIHILQNAVGENSDHGNEMLLFVPKNPGQGFLKELPEGNLDNEHQSKTKLVSLDKWAEEHGLFNNQAAKNDISIAILKVDVEGHEPQVLVGATRLLQSGMIKNVFTECRRFGRTNVKDMLLTLLNAGFTLREPNCDQCMKPTNSAESNANAFVEWATAKIGKNKGQTMDLWWEKKK